MREGNTAGAEGTRTPDPSLRTRDMGASRASDPQSDRSSSRDTSGSQWPCCTGHAVTRSLTQKAGVTGSHPTQLAVFDDPPRDERGWVLSVAHLAVIPYGALTGALRG
jgi:hypothetical protein